MFLECGDQAAEVVLFAGLRVRGETHSEPTPEERRRAVLLFMGWVAAKLSAGGEAGSD